MRKHPLGQDHLVGKALTMDGGCERPGFAEFPGSAQLATAKRGSRWHRLSARLNLVRLLVLLCATQIGARLADAAETFVVQLGGPVNPELLTINQGDTITFLCSPFYPLSLLTESYTGEWRSPLLAPGQSFSYTFTGPGTYVYRAGSSLSQQPYFPGVIKVQAVTNAYPAVWIARPLDNFTVPGYTDIEVATTNSSDSVKSVNFYADGQYLGSVTNPPYIFTAIFTAITNIGTTYNFTASVVDTTGQTNFSAPVRITFANQVPFGLWRLPEGQTVFFMSAAGGPYCLEWSQDLKTWSRRILGQQLGNSVIVDETTTNANVIRRFYKLVDCL